MQAALEPISRTERRQRLREQLAAPDPPPVTPEEAMELVQRVRARLGLAK